MIKRRVETCRVLVQSIINIVVNWNLKGWEYGIDQRWNDFKAETNVTGNETYGYNVFCAF